MASPIFIRRCLSVVALSIVAAALGGCGGGMSLNPGDWFSSSSSSSGPASSSDAGFTVFHGAAEGPVVRPVTAADLVGPDGHCEAAPAEGAAAPRLGLTMTECEMVALSGAPDQVNIGAEQAGERRTVLTYNKGDHPGIYTFVSGRLKVMEELPAPPKPEPKKRVAKKPSAKKPPAAAPAAAPTAAKPAVTKRAVKKPPVNRPPPASVD